jgi:cytochrome b561
VDRYHRARVALHWIIAAAALCQLALGWWMIGIPKTPPGLRAGWFNVHKSIGLTIGMAMLLRAWLWWRFPAPPLPASMPRWQAIAARANHALLYACLIVMPLSGYLGSSFTKYPIMYFGFALPHWGWDAPLLKEICSTVHFTTVCTLMALLALHIAAALKHAFVDRDAILRRMWFWTQGERS